MEESRREQGKAVLTIRTLGSTTREEITADGSSLLDILKKGHDIGITSSFPNRRLNCIDGVCVKQGFWWSIFVDGELVLKSADNYFPEKGDMISIEYGDGK